MSSRLQLQVKMKDYKQGIEVLKLHHDQLSIVMIPPCVVSEYQSLAFRVFEIGGNGVTLKSFIYALKGCLVHGLNTIHSTLCSVSKEFLYTGWKGVSWICVHYVQVPVKKKVHL